MPSSPENLKEHGSRAPSIVGLRASESKHRSHRDACLLSLVDLLIPSHQVPPDRAIRLEAGIAPDRAEAAARWADPVTDGWHERALELTDRGAEFTRYLVPADWVKVSVLNPILMTISGQIDQLSERLGHDVEDALGQVADFADGSPLDKITFLDEVFAELASSEMPMAFAADAP